MSKNRNNQAVEQIVEQTVDQQIEQSLVEQAKTVETPVEGHNDQVAAELYVYEQEQKNKVEPQTATDEAVKSILESSMNKSNKIRALLGLGLKRQPVADLLGIRYQHVRNVELTPLKKSVN